MKPSTRSDFWGGVTIRKVAAPELGEGQGKLVAERDLECFCCGKKVRLTSENPLSQRPKDPEKIPYWDPSVPNEAKPHTPPAGMTDHYLLSMPTKNPLSWRFDVPPGWTAVTTLPRSNWPGNFINRIERGVPPRIAVEACMKENEMYERWYCSTQCRVLEELEGHAMRENWSNLKLWFRKLIIKIAFSITDFMPNEDKPVTEFKVTKNRKAKGNLAEVSANDIRSCKSCQL